MIESIKDVLMERDGMSEAEADDLIAEAQECIDEIIESGGSLSEAEDVVADFFSLEPDYLMELL